MEAYGKIALLLLFPLLLGQGVCTLLVSESKQSDHCAVENHGYWNHRRRAQNRDWYCRGTLITAVTAVTYTAQSCHWSEGLLNAPTDLTTQSPAEVHGVTEIDFYFYCVAKDEDCDWNVHSSITHENTQTCFWIKDLFAEANRNFYSTAAVSKQILKPG